MSKTAEEDITEPCTPEGISEWAYTAANRSEGMSISQAVRIEKMIESYGNTYAEKMAVEFAEWIDSLPERELFTVHPPAGSGAGTGIYKKSLTDLYETFKKRNNH